MRFRAEAVCAGLLLASCATGPRPREAARPDAPRNRAPVSDAVVRVGPSYSVRGVTYRPSDDRDFDETGYASWYGEELRGRPTANGEAFDPDAITAAHRTLPLPSYVEVTALDSGRTALVRINDRGPFHRDRIIDVSLGAARQLGLTGGGARLVRVRRVEPNERDKLALRSGRSVTLRGGSSRELSAAREQSAWRAPDAVSQVIPAGAGPFFLQIASFISEDRAESLADKLGARVSAIAGTYRVRLGPFVTARAAQEALAPLAARGYPDAVLTR